MIWTVLHGDCLSWLRVMESGCIDAVVTDPPYALEFMGRDWDRVLPGVEVWREVYRVAKPGAHLVAFGGTRTFHRLTCAIEDAGWQIRDCLMWLYGSGFPKSLDVSKAVDREAGAEREVVGKNPTYREDQIEAPSWNLQRNPDLTAPATEAAKRWQGWGTALKPAWEPIILARKPFPGTVAGNVLEHGTGALNIDGCRIGNLGERNRHGGGSSEIFPERGNDSISTGGRWPANLILDEESAALLDEQSGERKTGGGDKSSTKPAGSPHGGIYGEYKNTERSGVITSPNRGGASRFFYTAKASRTEREAGLDGIETIVVTWDTWESMVREATRRVDTVTLQNGDIGGFTVPSLRNTEWNMLSFGKELTELCQKDIASITVTATNSITRSRTLNWLVSLLTSASIPVAKSETVSGGNLAEGAEICGPCLSITREPMGSPHGVGDALFKTQLIIKGNGATLVDDGRRKKIDNPYLRGKTPRVNLHPTIKPVDLMRWLVRLVTPPGGTVLDPFCGSGSTLVAARIEGFHGLGFEMEEEYCKIADTRIANAGIVAGDATADDAEKLPGPVQLGLLGET